jgi:cation diffusion facilitator CzcD-associated flavoprotein CzcO
MKDVAILGAGPAGLRMCAALKAADVGHTVYERHSDVGGLWDIDRPDTAMYSAAHFISSKSQSAFRDFPMPEDYPDYPSHRQILNWLRAYADRKGLHGHIRFGTEVRRIVRHDDHWLVQTGTGEGVPHRFVVLAHGSNWIPRLPHYPGHFDGEQRHSKSFRDLEEFRGRRVLIVGAGNSGCDIACEAARAADAAFISLRRGYHFLPKHVFGIPADAFAAGGPQLPLWLERPLFTLLLKMMTGDLTRLGLPKPDHRLFESHPILNTQILHYLQHGDLHARPDIERLDGTHVQFKDGRRERIDLIIYATGYEKPLDFIDCGQALSPDDFWLRVFSKSLPSLYSMSLFETNSGAYPLFDAMADLIAADIASQLAGGAAHRRVREHLAVAESRVHGGLSFIASERHRVYVDSGSFRRTAAKLLRQYPRSELLSAAHASTRSQ